MPITAAMIIVMIVMMVMLIMMMIAITDRDRVPCLDHRA